MTVRTGTEWEIFCRSRRLDPLKANPEMFKSWKGDEVTTTCHKCGAEIGGQYYLCLPCEGK